jgi:sugar/nucleoside kinase (ribokinase family)
LNVPGQKPIVVVGSINTDLVASAKVIPAIGETVMGTDFQIHPGGKGANQAVAVARLGYPVSMIGRLGNDAFGEQLRKHLEGAGVDTAGIAISDGTSGVAVIVVSEKGENSIIVTPGANALAHLPTLTQISIVFAMPESCLPNLRFPSKRLSIWVSFARAKMSRLSSTLPPPWICRQESSGM